MVAKKSTTLVATLIADRAGGVGQSDDFLYLAERNVQINWLEIVVWVGIGVVTYTYIGYPLLMWLLACVLPRPIAVNAKPPRTFSVILAVHNEQDCIGRRIDEFALLVSRSRYQGELIVVSDGSTDDTAKIAKSRQSDTCRVIELPTNQGKAQALNIGAATSHADILVFADARQVWSENAIDSLLTNFVDSRVGGVSGELVIQSPQGATEGIGAYWKFEKWIRANESQYWSTVGVSGSISAVRRANLAIIPPNTILDDVYWPMQLALNGFRTIISSDALAFDRLPESASGEFRRKVRTLAGNFQLMQLLPVIFIPCKNPVWFQFVSHKLLRLVAPWMIISEFIACGFAGQRIYNWLLIMQAMVFVLGVYGLLRGATRRVHFLVSASASFLLLNVAAVYAFWVWISGNAARSWKKSDYSNG